MIYTIAARVSTTRHRVARDLANTVQSWPVAVTPCNRPEAEATDKLVSTSLDPLRRR
jgi:hypothetical protein